MDRGPICYGVHKYFGASFIKTTRATSFNEYDILSHKLWARVTAKQNVNIVLLLETYMISMPYK